MRKGIRVRVSCVEKTAGLKILWWECVWQLWRNRIYGYNALVSSKESGVDAAGKVKQEANHVGLEANLKTSVLSPFCVRTMEVIGWF